ncbi:MAG: galactokinase [Fidelibacterota bacterium]
MNLRSRILRSFNQRFRREPSLLVRAPGRINLIGEHTDYNLGYVLPTAINRWVMVGLSSRSDHRCHVFATDYDQKDSFALKSIQKHQEYLWANIVRGVARILADQGTPTGFNAVITGTIPIGSGLSSSAAAEVAMATGLSALWNLNVEGPSLARLCNRVEREFLGIMSGIMDPFVSALGKSGHAIFLDCRDLSYRYIPLPLDDYHLGVVNPLIPRDLARSPYNQRVQECREAVEIIRKTGRSVTSPRDVTWEILKESETQLGPVLFRRLRHVISENERTVKAVDHLTNVRVSSFGALLYDSHASLRDDFEVSCEELDTLVSLCSDSGGYCLGARMVGGGFGGCVMALVKRERWTPFTRTVSQGYRSRFGSTPEILRLKASAGVHTIRELW